MSAGLSQTYESTRKTGLSEQLLFCMPLDTWITLISVACSRYIMLQKHNSKIYLAGWYGTSMKCKQLLWNSIAKNIKMYHIIKLNICFNLIEIGCEKPHVTDICTLQKMSKILFLWIPFYTFARTAFTGARWTDKLHKYIYSNRAFGWEQKKTLKCNRLQTNLMNEKATDRKQYDYNNC